MRSAKLHSMNEATAQAIASMWRKGIGRSEGFPARDIWVLGVILPVLSQMERVAGTPPPPPPLPSLEK